MSAVIRTPAPATARLALAAGDHARVVAFDGSERVTLARFLAETRAVAAALPAGRHVVNLCEDRYRFLVALGAAALRGQVTLLPASRAPETVAAACAGHRDSYCIGDRAESISAAVDYWPLPARLPRQDGPPPMLAADALAVIGFTSGSTGASTAHPKTWGRFRIGAIQNLAALRYLWPRGVGVRVVATVPAQHMYGMEMSVLLPLFGNVAVHAGRPFFPDDVARALAAAGEPTLLVTTPVHLHALVESGVRFGPVAGIVSATAPLSPELAGAAEARFGCQVREVFGATESCIFAHRRTALEAVWTLMPGARITPRPDGAQVCARHLPAPVMLADLVDIPAAGRFVLRGRNADVLEIAGKRASLGELTSKLLAVPGVRDGVVLQLDADARGVRRIAALAVAPDVGEEQILRVLRRSMDPVFLPRVLKRVTELPRNETGKLPRARMLALLRR